MYCWRTTTSILALAFLAAFASHAALQLRLEAGNYDPGTGTWTDSSGNNNHANQATPGNRPSLVANQTATGAPALRFDGSTDFLTLSAGIPTTSANGFTVLAYLRPNGGRTIVAGGLGSFQHRISGSLQQVVEANQQQRGTSNTALSTTNFSSVSAQGNSAGGSFCLNGNPDGALSAQAFAPYEPITHVGRKNVGSTELFSGDIVEIRVYDEQLSAAAIQAAEAEFIASYGVPGLQLQLQATNYDPVAGTWADSSVNGNDATQATAASRPSLVGSQTANGSPAVRFDGTDDFLDLTSWIPTTATAGFTVIAYLRPRASSRTIVGGGLGSFQHRIDNLFQQVIEANQAQRGTSNTALSTVTFSSVVAQGNNVGGSFCLNGNPDGTLTAQIAAPYEAITRVGNKNVGGNEWYSGDIVEIRIYDAQLSTAAIQAVESELNASYQTITNAVSLPNIANPSFDIDASLFNTFPGYVAPINTANPTEIVGWPGTGSRGLNPGGGGAGTAFRNNGNNAGQVGFIQRAGSISQVTSGWEIGKNYRLTFDYNARTTPPASFSAAIDAASYSDPSVPAVGGSFGYYAANLLVTPTTATPTLTVNNLNGANDNTLLLDNFRVFRTGPSIADNGFENPVQPANNWKQANGTGGGDLTGSAWTITGAGGITRNRGALHPSMYAAEGEQFALLQATSALAQAVNGFNPGAQYSLSLLAMRRTAGGRAATTWKLSLMPA